MALLLHWILSAISLLIVATIDDESTPPLNAQIARCPASAWSIAATASLRNDPMVHVIPHPHKPCTN